MSTAANFEQAMRRVYQEAWECYRYNVSRFLTLIDQEGGVKAAKKLLQSSETTWASGFTVLLVLDALHLSVEYLVLQKEWGSLFSPEELAIARMRLKKTAPNLLVESAE